LLKKIRKRKNREKGKKKNGGNNDKKLIKEDLGCLQHLVDDPYFKI